MVRGHLYTFVKKNFALILQLCCAPLVLQIYQKILLSDPRWRTWFLGRAHFYRGKIDRFCLKWCQKINTHLGGFKMVQLVRIKSAKNFDQNGTQ